MNTAQNKDPSPGRVAAFSGHMVDSPGRRIPRFPEYKIEPVRREIAHALDNLNIKEGFSSAARGGDLLFIEELLKRDGKAHVYLPFPRDAFAQTSVGFGWDPLYFQILNDSRVQVVELAAQLPPSGEHGRAYDHCNQIIQDEAIKSAQKAGIEPVLLTVWNGNPGDDRGGTADAVKAWELHGYQIVVIDLAHLG